MKAQNKYSVLKHKEGFSSQCRTYTEHRFKKDVLNELESIKHSWVKNGGYIVRFNKEKLILVVSEPDDSAQYVYEILENYNFKNL